MAVEIRELVIKTEIRSQHEQDTAFSQQSMNKLKEEVMEACRHMIREVKHRKTRKR